jgi:hypothetical protein
MFKKLWEIIKAFGLKIWGKIKAFTLKVWNQIKLWFEKRGLPWLKKNWMQIVNLIVLFIVYGNTDTLPVVQTISGLWVFVLLGYYIFWKFFGAEKLFIKSPKLNPQPEPPKPTVVEPVKATKPVAKKTKK